MKSAWEICKFLLIAVGAAIVLTIAPSASGSTYVYQGSDVDIDVDDDYSDSDSGQGYYWEEDRISDDYQDVSGDNYSMDVYLWSKLEVWSFIQVYGTGWMTHTVQGLSISAATLSWVWDGPPGTAPGLTCDYWYDSYGYAYASSHVSGWGGQTTAYGGADTTANISCFDGGASVGGSGVALAQTPSAPGTGYAQASAIPSRESNEIETHLETGLGEATAWISWYVSYDDQAELDEGNPEFLWWIQVYHGQNTSGTCVFGDDSNDFGVADAYGGSVTDVWAACEITVN